METGIDMQQYLRLPLDKDEVEQSKNAQSSQLQNVRKNIVKKSPT